MHQQENVLVNLLFVYYIYSDIRSDIKHIVICNVL